VLTRARAVVASAQATTAARWSRLRERRPAVRHGVQAWQRLQDNNGGQYAGAITYFSFLALFPLLLLLIAVAGYVLQAHPAALNTLLEHITANVPGELGTSLRQSAKGAVRLRTSFGVAGVVGLLLAGLGWIGNLRAAVNAMWGRRPQARNIFVAKFADAIVLCGLGLALLVSLGLTALGTELSGRVLRAIGLGGASGTHEAIRVLGIVLALIGDYLIFWWLLVRLPDAQVPWLTGVKGAVLAAAGFELLKIVGTYTIAHSAQRPALGPFAGLLAVLIWIQLVARLLLFCAAWTAVLTLAAQPPPDEPAVEAAAPGPASAPVAREHASRAVASLVGLGAVIGAALALLATARRASAKDRRAG